MTPGRRPAYAAVVPIDDLRVLVFAIAFGALMGWGMGRRAEDRRATVAASAVATIAGIATWIVVLATDAPSGGSLAVPAVSLTAGAGAALASLVITGRR